MLLAVLPWQNSEILPLFVMPAAVYPWLKKDRARKNALLSLMNWQQHHFYQAQSLCFAWGAESSML
jgi:hypothetical protein